MSTTSKRMVKVPVTLDVDVAKWSEARGVGPRDLAADVRYYVHDVVRGMLMRKGAAATLREQPGEAPRDVELEQQSLRLPGELDKTAFALMLHLYEVHEDIRETNGAGLESHDAAQELRGALRLYCALTGASHVAVREALAAASEGGMS